MSICLIIFYRFQTALRPELRRGISQMDYSCLEPGGTCGQCGKLSAKCTHRGLDWTGKWL